MKKVAFILCLAAAVVFATAANFDHPWNLLAGKSITGGSGYQNGCAVVSYDPSYAIIQCIQVNGVTQTGSVYIFIPTSGASFEVQIGSFTYRENNIPANVWTKINFNLNGSPPTNGNITLKFSGLTTSSSVKIDEFHCGTFYESFNNLSNSGVASSSAGRVKALFR